MFGLLRVGSERELAGRTRACRRVVERDELAVAAEEDAKRLSRAHEQLCTPVQLLHSGPRHLVDPPRRPALRRLPGGPDEAVTLERTERAVESAGVISREAERPKALEQVVAVSRLLA